MVKMEENGKKQYADKARQYSGQHPDKHRFPVLLKQLNLLIQRDCKAYSCGSEQITKALGSCLVGLVTCA